MATDARTEPRGGGGGTALGPSANLLAALGYLFNLIGAILLLVLEEDAYVRHHAAQSLLFTGAVVVARFVVGIVAPVGGFVPVLGDPVAALLGFAVWAGAGLGFLFLMYKGFTGQRYRLPVLGAYIDDVEGAF
jgi:uncharacterized membrane protein